MAAEELVHEELGPTNSQFELELPNELADKSDVELEKIREEIRAGALPLNRPDRWPNRPRRPYR